MNNLLVLSDTHFLKNKKDSLFGWNVYEQTAKALDLADQHFNYEGILITGDLTNYGDLESYQLLHELLETKKVPIFALPGNHDLPENQFQIFPQKRMVHLNSKWSLILLNSWRRGDIAGELTDEELYFLRTTLEENPQRSFLVCLHHPPYSIGVDWLDELSLSNRDDFWSNLNENVKGVLFGHAHCSFETKVDELPIMCTPSPWVQFALGQGGAKYDDIPGGIRTFRCEENGEFTTEVIRFSN